MRRTYMLDRLWDFFAESCQAFFFPLVCAYYAIGGSLFLSCASSDAAGLEKIGDTLLIPFKYVFCGQMATPTDQGEWVFTQRFDYTNAFWVKTGASAIALPISVVLGGAVKGLACLSSECRARMAAKTAFYFDSNVHVPPERYQAWGVQIEEAKPFISQGHLRRPGDEQNLSIEKKALGEIGALLTKAGIPWWIDCGTCLGAYRYGGVIPWDEDIDIAVLEPDFDLVRKTLLQLDPQKYLVQDWSSRLTPQNFFKVYVRQTNRLIDIYHFAIEPETRTLRYIFSLDTNPMFPEWIKIRERRFTVPTSFASVFPLKKTLFDGIEVFLPNDPETYLKRYYGDNLDPVKTYDPLTKRYEKVLTHPYWQREYVH